MMRIQIEFGGIEVKRELRRGARFEIGPTCKRIQVDRNRRAIPDTLVNQRALPHLDIYMSIQRSHQLLWRAPPTGQSHIKLHGTALRANPGEMHLLHRKDLRQIKTRSLGCHGHCRQVSGVIDKSA